MYTVSLNRVTPAARFQGIRLAPVRAVTSQPMSLLSNKAVTKHRLRTVPLPAPAHRRAGPPVRIHAIARNRHAASAAAVGPSPTAVPGAVLSFQRKIAIPHATMSTCLFPPPRTLRLYFASSE
ncbi:hypothetical protein EVAR_56532_1 [Eumeta japonica]|uniref:Uncharacterized protein n=1 Tax=Eumeta variegata TaxID=151549 RepID=A0A4C1YXH3_EUMVA|nr:hypothetical protein EVAR_56532_1 [Eumeta japonica]